jgi:hypothetical protein
MQINISIFGIENIEFLKHEIRILLIDEKNKIEKYWHW